MPSTHCVALFLLAALFFLQIGLSKVVDVPVAPDDGLKSNMNGRVGSKFTPVPSRKPSEHIPTILQMVKCFLLLGLEY